MRFSLSPKSVNQETPKSGTLRLEKQFTRIENLEAPSIVKKFAVECRDQTARLHNRYFRQRVV